MIDSSSRIRQSVASFLFLAAAGAVLAQGPLLPPTSANGTIGTVPPISGSGIPQGSMKTLHQIEPRTPVSAAMTISDPGSYYLVQNIAVASGNGIVITAPNVTLDMRGFTVSSTASPAAGTAVLIESTAEQVTIFNGNIRGNVSFSGGSPGSYSGSGFLHGIRAPSLNSENLRLEDVSIDGCLGDGINLEPGSGSGFGGNNSIVTTCLVRNVAGDGIRAEIVEECVVRRCGGNGVTALKASHCAVVTTGSSGVTSEGINASVLQSSIAESPQRGIAAEQAVNCRGAGVSQEGIVGKKLTNCDGSSSQGAGVSADIAVNCRGFSFFGTGLSAQTATNCMGENQSGINGRGLSASCAVNCYGESLSGAFGLTVAGTVSFSTGKRNGGVAIEGGNAIGCTVEGTGSVSVLTKSLGTP
ncbi:MAG: hypothetical protein AAGA58_05730 [Verrucomicrobiota bacterium]